MNKGKSLLDQSKKANRSWKGESSGTSERSSNERRERKNKEARRELEEGDYIANDLSTLVSRSLLVEPRTSLWHPMEREVQGKDREELLYFGHSSFLESQLEVEEATSPTTTSTHDETSHLKEEVKNLERELDSLQKRLRNAERKIERMERVLLISHNIRPPSSS